MLPDEKKHELALLFYFRKLIQGWKEHTLAYFGTEDGVIGDAKKAKKLAENIPGVRVVIVESGHMIGAELADRVNAEILDFLEKNDAKDENPKGKSRIDNLFNL